MVVPGLLVREFELELEFDAARSENTSFCGREDCAGVVVVVVAERRSFSFCGFWGAELEGEAVDQRSANESVINAVVGRLGDMEVGMVGWMAGSKWETLAATTRRRRPQSAAGCLVPLH